MASSKYFKALVAFYAISICAFIFPVSADEPIKNRLSLIGEMVPVTGDIANTDLYVGFQLGSAHLTDTAKAQLNELGAALTDPALDNLDMALYGHTDASGSAKTNLILSKRRARSVYEYLVQNFDLASRTIAHAGLGETSPLNPIDIYAAENRRVEIVTTKHQIKAQATPVTGETQAIN